MFKINERQPSDVAFEILLVESEVAKTRVKIAKLEKELQDLRQEYHIALDLEDESMKHC